MHMPGLANRHTQQAESFYGGSCVPFGFLIAAGFTASRPKLLLLLLPPLFGGPRGRALLPAYTSRVPRGSDSHHHCWILTGNTPPEGWPRHRPSPGPHLDALLVPWSCSSLLR